MVRKVGIIGLGHVGSAVAHGLVAQGAADEFIFLDPNEAKVKAEATDFEDAMANLEYNAQFKVNDWSALKDAEIVVSALGKIALNRDNPKNDRFVELPFTQEQVAIAAKQLKDSGFHGILVVITNPVDVITDLYQTITGLPKEHVIGTGTLLDSARMKRVVGLKLGINPQSVAGYNLGEHGNSQFTAWSTVRVKDQVITDLIDQEGLAELDQAARDGGFTVFSGKFFTSYGVATAAIKLVKAIFTNSNEVLPVSNFREEYGTYLSYPAVVGRDGIIEQLQLKLTDEESDKLQASADFIKSRIQDVKKQLGLQ